MHPQSTTRYTRFGVLNHDMSPENLKVLMVVITIALLLASVVIWFIFQRMIGKGK